MYVPAIIDLCGVLLVYYMLSNLHHLLTPDYNQLGKAGNSPELHEVQTFEPKLKKLAFDYRKPGWDLKKATEAMVAN